MVEFREAPTFCEDSVEEVPASPHLRGNPWWHQYKCESSRQKGGPWEKVTLTVVYVQPKRLPLTAESQAGQKLAQLMRESQDLIKLAHDNVVKHYYTVAVENSCFFRFPHILAATEDTSGFKTLDDASKYTPFGKDQTISWLGELVAAIGYIHSRDIVHGNLSMSSVLVQPDGRLKVTDFRTTNEIKWFEATEADHRNWTMAELEFTAPENVELWPGKCVYTKQTDIWSVGCLAVQLLIPNGVIYRYSYRAQLDGGFDPKAWLELKKRILERGPDRTFIQSGTTVTDFFLRRFIERCLRIAPSQRPGAETMTNLFKFRSEDRQRSGSNEEALYDRGTTVNAPLNPEGDYLYHRLLAQLKSEGPGIFSTESLTKRLEQIYNAFKAVPLKVALLGRVKAGKSSLVNAIRGLKPKHANAAPVGATQTTMKATPYPHQEHDNLCFYDCPGVGTEEFPATRYWQDIEGDKFDFFIVVCAEAFPSEYCMIIQEIIAAGKELVFVRTKIHADVRNLIENNQIEPEDEAEEVAKLKQEIRDEVAQGLAAIKDAAGSKQDEKFQQSLAPENIFLIDSYQPHLYEYGRMIQVMFNKFPAAKHDAFVLSMSNTCIAIVDAKVALLRSGIKAAVPDWAVAGAVPVLGVSTVADVTILLSQTKYFMEQLGLNLWEVFGDSLITNREGTSPQKKDEPTVAKQISDKFLLDLLNESGMLRFETFVEEGFSEATKLLYRMPAVGPFTSAHMTYRNLNRVLDVLSKKAKDKIVHATQQTTKA